MKMKGWAPAWALSVTSGDWQGTGRKGEEQRGDELQRTVPMSSASSVLELPATSCSSSALISSCSTASTMGITMAVVEVLESHMDSMVVQHMKQSRSLDGGQGPLGRALTCCIGLLRPTGTIQPQTPSAWCRVNLYLSTGPVINSHNTASE